MIYVKIKSTEVAPEALESVIDALPAWRKAQVMRIRNEQGRRNCALAYELLCEMLRERGIATRPTFVYAPDGKPGMLELPELHFNLSHCATAVACAISDREVGIDIETLGRFKESLAAYAMNEAEYRSIMEAEDRDRAFTRLWTMKEATAKLTGEGIGTNMRNVLAHSYNIIYNTTIYEEVGCVMTTAQHKAI